MMARLLHRLSRAFQKGLPLLMHLPRTLTLHQRLREHGTTLMPKSPHRWARGVQFATYPVFSRTFTAGQRLWALECHERYESLLSTMARALHGAALDPEGRLSLALDRADHSWHEGRTVLEYRFDGLTLFTFTFTIVPGRLCGWNQGDCLFVGGSQGRKEEREAIRQASLAYHDISPMGLSFLGIQALASALGLVGIAGVTIQRQVAEAMAHRTDHSLYDQLWFGLGGQEGPGYFRLPLSPLGKDLSLVAARHRRRARQRQQDKLELFQRLRTLLSGGVSLVEAPGSLVAQPRVPSPMNFSLRSVP